MRRSRRAWLSIALLTALQARAAAEFTVTEIAPGDFVHFGRMLPLDAPGHDDIANIGFIIGSRCIAVVDSGGSVRMGRALHAAIRARSSLPICYVINTHGHVDHVLGNAAFRDDHARFVGHALLGAALVRSRELFLRDYAEDLDAPANAAQIVGPQQLVPVGQDLQLDLGGHALLLHAWPRAHTDCDLTVYDEATGTLWTGDLLFVGRTPALDGSLTGWLKVTQALAEMHVRHFIPGHGPAGEELRLALAPEQRYLQALLQQVRADIAAGRPLQEAIREPYPRIASEWQLWDATHPRNVTRAYQELEWE